MNTNWYTTYEVISPPPDSMNRLCLMTLSRLYVSEPLGSKVSSISIAVKLKGAKRTLRSNEIELPCNGLIDTEILLHYTLRYTHFYKHNGNKLHVMLQQRKKYATKLFLRYKTIADGVINLSEIVQFPQILELNLFRTKKKHKRISYNSCAMVLVRYLCSLPVDYEERTKTARDNVQIGDDFYQIIRKNDESDSEAVMEDRRDGKTSDMPNVKRNLVNKNLHKRDKDRKTTLAGGHLDAPKTDLCDTDTEIDSSSISSPPRPTLKRFFSSSSMSLLQDSVDLSASVKKIISSKISWLSSYKSEKVVGKCRKIKRLKLKTKHVDGKRRSIGRYPYKKDIIFSKIESCCRY